MVSLLFFLDKYDFAKEHSLPVVAKKMSAFHFYEPFLLEK
jgi:hypothetical protein